MSFFRTVRAIVHQGIRPYSVLELLVTLSTGLATLFTTMLIALMAAPWERALEFGSALWLISLLVSVALAEWVNSAELW